MNPNHRMGLRKRVGLYLFLWGHPVSSVSAARAACPGKLQPREWSYGESSCSRLAGGTVGRPKVGLGIYIYSCHAGELFGFVPVARDEQAFSC